MHRAGIYVNTDYNRIVNYIIIFAYEWQLKMNHRSNLCIVLCNIQWYLINDGQ